MPPHGKTFGKQVAPGPHTAMFDIISQDVVVAAVDASFALKLFDEKGSVLSMEVAGGLDKDALLKIATVGRDGPTPFGPHPYHI